MLGTTSALRRLTGELFPRGCAGSVRLRNRTSRLASPSNRHLTLQPHQLPVEATHIPGHFFLGGGVIMLALEPLFHEGLLVLHPVTLGSDPAFHQLLIEIPLRWS